MEALHFYEGLTLDITNKNAKLIFMSMTWADITVGQFLDIYQLSIKADVDDMEKAERAVSIIYGKSQREIDEMLMLEFNKLSAAAGKFLTTNIPGKAKRIISAGRNRYKIIYYVSKLQHRQYVEAIHFGAKPYENMHFMLASIVKPVRWGFARKNKAEEHEKVAMDMLNAKVCDVYHACVFFCNLYKSLIESMRDYLVNTMTQTGKISKDKAEMLITLSTVDLVGYTARQSSQSMKG